jgi:hypothetical protein
MNNQYELHGFSAFRHVWQVAFCQASNFVCCRSYPFGAFGAVAKFGILDGRTSVGMGGCVGRMEARLLRFLSEDYGCLVGTLGSGNRDTLRSGGGTTIASVVTKVPLGVCGGSCRLLGCLGRDARALW